MPFRVRPLAPDGNLGRALTLDLLEPVIPMPLIEAVLRRTGVRTLRQRKLRLEAVVLFVIAMNLWAHTSMADVLRQLAHGLRLLRFEEPVSLPTVSALVYRRAQLGVRPMAALVREVCRPLATPHTRGAFLGGLRLMALDANRFDVPDTPANQAYFGRPPSGRGESAFPQVEAVCLCECGTHAVVDVGFWPCRTGELKGAFRLLRSVGPGMLVLWDRGLYHFDLFRRAQARGAHVLARITASLKPEPVRQLPDGSYLAWLRPYDKKRRRREAPLLVRVIRYTLNDPTRPGCGEVHRLVTTLLDPEAYPAVTLAAAYHERWEIELVNDEMDSHQRLPHQPLRSRTPLGVLQELYGLFLAHYALRFLMHEAARQQDQDPDQLSFVASLRLVRAAVADFQLLDPALHPMLFHQLLHDLAACRLPKRRNRSNPRVVKRKMSVFPVKRPEHQHRPQPTRPFAETVVLI